MCSTFSIIHPSHTAVRGNLGFSILPKDTVAGRTEDTGKGPPMWITRSSTTATSNHFIPNEGLILLGSLVTPAGLSGHLHILWLTLGDIPPVLSMVLNHSSATIKTDELLCTLFAPDEYFWLAGVLSFNGWMYELNPNKELELLQSNLNRGSHCHQLPATHQLLHWTGINTET